MKTPKEFDYDLWTTEENGNKKYWVRVKATGEVSEVDLETMRFLRCEEKALRRIIEKTAENKPLSLDYIKDDETNNRWMADVKDVADEVILSIEEKAFMDALTEKQKDMYLNCLQAGCSLRCYGESKNLAIATVRDLQRGIRKKYKKIF